MQPFLRIFGVQVLEQSFVMTRVRLWERASEILACRRAVEFAIDIGLTELVIEGDSA